VPSVKLKVLVSMFPYCAVAPKVQYMYSKIRIGMKECELMHVVHVVLRLCLTCSDILSRSPKSRETQSSRKTTSEGWERE
jgi:hypothetical protein